jgi:hypothetical protein
MRKHLRDVAEHRAGLDVLEAPAEDLDALHHLEDAAVRPVPAVAERALLARADDHVEGLVLHHLAVQRVRHVAAEVEVDARAAQHRTGQAEVERHLLRDHADVRRALHEDLVHHEEVDVFLPLLLEHVAEAAHFLEPAGGRVVEHAADPDVAVREPRAADLLEQRHHPLALAERVEEGRERADVEAVRAERDQVAADPVQLGADRPDHLRAPRDLEPGHQGLDGHAVAQVVVHRREVVVAVGVRQVLEPLDVLADLLRAAVEVAEVRLARR